MKARNLSSIKENLLFSGDTIIFVRFLVSQNILSFNISMFGGIEKVSSEVKAKAFFSIIRRLI